MGSLLQLWSLATIIRWQHAYHKNGIGTAKGSIIRFFGSIEFTNSQATSYQTSIQGAVTENASQVVNMMTSIQETVLLVMARVKLISDSSRKIPICASLDSASEMSFITERVAQQLFLKRQGQCDSQCDSLQEIMVNRLMRSRSP
jgi:hypothetical protein